MATLTLTVTSPTTGVLNDGVREHTITGSNPEDVRNQVTKFAADHAQYIGEETYLTVYENGQTFHVGIGPDGKRNLSPTPPQNTAPSPAETTPPAAPPAEPTPPVASAPSAPEPAVSAPLEPQPQTVEPTPPPAPVAQQQQAPANPFSQTAPSPAPTNTNSTETGAWTPQPIYHFNENDPAWQEEKSAPATQGARGSMNNVFRSKLRPAQRELDERKQAFIERETLKAQERAREAQAEAERSKRQAERKRAAEQKASAARSVIQTAFQSTRTILIANPKGGARKTTTTYLLAATMGIIRGGSVIAWDANETMGTLGERALQDLHTRTVVDLLEEAAPSFNSVESSRVGTLDAFVRPQGDSHFDVLASDEDPTRQDIVDATGFETVHEILSRFYRMILIDTGNNIRVSHFRRALDAADQLVIPVAASRDSAKVAEQMMRSFEASGHGDLVKRAVVLLHDLEPENKADEAYLDVVRTIAGRLEPQVAAVIPVPFDSTLKGGDEIDYAALNEKTRTAYQEAAAAVATTMRDTMKNS